MTATGPDDAAALPAGGAIAGDPRGGVSGALHAAGTMDDAMTGPPHAPAPDSPEASRLRRLRMRSWRRGMREADLLLGQFADAELAGMAAADLDLYEALLEENDQDLYAWIVAASVGRDAVPERFRLLVARIAHAAEARLERYQEPASSHGDQ